MAETFPGRSPYEYVFSNPVKLIDPTGMAPDSVDGVETKYKNKNTGEVVEINDGKNVEVEVGDYDYAMATLFKSVISNKILLEGDEWSENIRSKYEDFYFKTVHKSADYNFKETFSYWYDLAFGPKLPMKSVKIALGEGAFDLMGGMGKSSIKYLSLTYKELKTLRLTEAGAQSEKSILYFIDRMKANDAMSIYNKPIYIYEYKGVNYLLDGHHRVEAATRSQKSLDVIKLGKEKAMEIDPEKVKQIHQGLFK